MRSRRLIDVALGQAKGFLQAELEARVQRVIVIRQSSARAFRAIGEKRGRWSGPRLAEVKSLGSWLLEEEEMLREEEMSIAHALVCLEDVGPGKLRTPIAVLKRFAATLESGSPRSAGYRRKSRGPRSVPLTRLRSLILILSEYDAMRGG